MTQLKKENLYKEYLKVKEEGKIKGKISKLCLKYGIKKQVLYNTIRSVEIGNAKKIKKANNAAIWDHKYKFRVSLIPKTRNPFAVKMLKLVINDMKKEGFNVSEISFFLGKDRSTISHHLKK